MKFCAKFANEYFAELFSEEIILLDTTIIQIPGVFWILKESIVFFNSYICMRNEEKKTREKKTLHVWYIVKTPNLSWTILFWCIKCQLCEKIGIIWLKWDADSRGMLMQNLWCTRKALPIAYICIFMSQNLCSTSCVFVFIYIFFLWYNLSFEDNKGCYCQWLSLFPCQLLQQFKRMSNMVHK